MADNVIAILDEDGNELLSTLTNIGVSVSVSKTFAKHSLENGQTVTDDQYDNPTLLNMQIILDPSDYVSVYKEIKTYYENVTNFTIQTKVDSYSNMFLESLPHDETPEMFTTIAMTLEFTEQLISETSTETLAESDVSTASDTTTVDSGEKSTTSDDDGTVLQRLVSNAEEDAA